MADATLAARRVPKPRTAQAWIELKAEDPAAVSAAMVMRSRLAAGREVAWLRRLRLIELHGLLPTRPRLENLLHESIQFYNPHKERCHLRTRPKDPAPLVADEHVILVTDRGDERRGAAERWWFHETGKPVEVREGIAWVVRFAAEGGASAGRRDAPLEDLAVVRDRSHGIFCNPKCQDARIAAARIPLAWLTPESQATAASSEKPAASPAGDGENP